MMTSQKKAMESTLKTSSMNYQQDKEQKNQTNLLVKIPPKRFLRK